MKSTHSIIFEFFLPIQQILYKTIWPQHNSLLRAWERTQGIIKRKNDMLDVLLRTVHLRPLLPISEPSHPRSRFTLPGFRLLCGLSLLLLIIYIQERENGPPFCDIIII
ncbi:2508_t:CDS:2 [Rhizophagus irregularis]|nr:2508_t:CDS:2 [Rhizophagus irregularis]